MGLAQIQISSRGWSLESSELFTTSVNYFHADCLCCRDRVMETVQQSKTLPPEMAAQKLANVNLFMRALGLDVELLG